MNNNVVFLSVTDNYPLQYSANNSKNELLAKTIGQSGCSVSIINALNGFPAASDNYGTRDNIDYYVFKKGGIGQVFKNLMSTYKILKKIRRDNNYLLVGYSYFPIFISYVLMAKILGYKKVVTITEWHLYFEGKSAFKKLNYRLFDNLFGYFVEGVLPISDIIIDKISHFKKPVLKVPILADYNSIAAKPYVVNDPEEEYFLYCGDIAYLSIIEFVIDSFKLFVNKGYHQKLHLVVNGTPADLQKVPGLISKNGLDGKVILSTKLPFTKLIEEFQGALALLIPLRTEKQDTARFPHKIGEYIGTARPVITGAVGEISNYFTNNVSAYLADDFSLQVYAGLMEQAATNKQQATEIGAAGRKIGEDNFNYTDYGIKITNFLNTL